MATKVTQISLMVSVALGKHQIAQQLLGHHCSVRSEKQTAMAENSFDWCWCARCTKKRFRFPEVASSMQNCKLFVIPHKVAKYCSLSSIKYQLDECKIWGNDSRHEKCGLLIMRFVLSFIKVLKMSRLFRQDQEQDFYFKTKTKTIFHVLDAPRDQDQGLETTSLLPRGGMPIVYQTQNLCFHQIWLSSAKASPDITFLGDTASELWSYLYISSWF